VDFPEGCVTYKLTLGDTQLPDGTTTISSIGLSGNLVKLTQTFYYNGNPIINGSRSVVLELLTQYFTGWICVSETDFTTLSAIPSIDLFDNLIKRIVHN
ncbi:MAG: hypothetical protein LBB89_07285, partial [Treponema sp.]|nr:hypothetical protein [Treponema sp.]